MQNKLSEKELQRYSRQIKLQEIKLEGQLKLKNSKVLIVGAGGLGSPAAIYLATSGVGTIGIIDFDKVDESNLQRQILHSTDSLGALKTESALKALKKLNNEIEIKTYNEKLTSRNKEIIKDYDVVIDGSDNLPTRYIINDTCVELKKPFVYGAVLKFEGQVSVFTRGGPCYRCLLPELPLDSDSCEQAGVLGSIPGVIGTIQATEALKIILGIGEVLSGKLLSYNALSMKFTELKLNKKKDCVVCGGVD